MPYTKLKEFSVVYTDRSLNHMSDEFVDVMKDISTLLKTVYNTTSAVIVPGSGTFGMEAVARQFATDATVLIIRNGWFSYRWSEIFDMAGITEDVTVIMGKATSDQYQAEYTPPAVSTVVDWIHANRPAVVFAPHVETSAGMILPDDYLQQIGAACQAVDALFVLDCVASGAAWVDMTQCGVDVLITAPQKGWTSTPCCALIAMSERARSRIDVTTSTSYSIDLKKWLSVMETYEKGGFVYHTTMATDGLKQLRDTMQETADIGFDLLKQRQYNLGHQVHDLLQRYGYPRVAAPGFYAPGVIVCYTTDAGLQNATKFRSIGYQTAAGVPLRIDERSDFKTFRIGLFGLDKLMNIENTVQSLEQALIEIKSQQD